MLTAIYDMGDQGQYATGSCRRDPVPKGVLRDIIGGRNAAAHGVNNSDTSANVKELHSGVVQGKIPGEKIQVVIQGEKIQVPTAKGQEIELMCAQRDS